MIPAELAAIHANSFTTPRPWSEQEFIDLLADPTIFMFSETGGFALLRVIGPEAELLTIAVDPALQRQRIASRLMQTLKAHAKSAGVENIFLEVSALNEPAHRLYTSCGFITSATRKDYYSGPKGQKISADIMTLALLPNGNS